MPLPSGENSPEYLKRVPERDGWGNHYIFALNEVNLLGASVIAIYSGARDGDTGNAVTTCDDDVSVRPGNHGYFDSRRFDCDIV